MGACSRPDRRLQAASLPLHRPERRQLKTSCPGFVRRWTIEVTFAEVRRHLGVETQRQWSDQAIARTTPALLGLYALVALWADAMHQTHALVGRSARWYQKDKLTFSDALAAVRRQLWADDTLSNFSPRHRDNTNTSAGVRAHGQPRLLRRVNAQSRAEKSNNSFSGFQHSYNQHITYWPPSSRLGGYPTGNFYAPK